jgi:MFS transporter, putative metabolite:H+ symporter
LRPSISLASCGSIYIIGAALAIFGLLLRFRLPESPRWPISQGRLADAEQVVSAMENQAIKRVGTLPPVSSELPFRKITHSTGYAAIFGNALYVKRTILLLVIWLTGYITVYCVIAGLTVILVPLGYPASEAGLIAAVGTVGGICAGIAAYCFGERLESKYWILIAAMLTLCGGMLIALSGGLLILATPSIPTPS